jgi:hypothetical protein
MWYFDNHTRCENLHTLEALQERDSCRHYKTLAGRPAQTPAGLTEGLSLIREDGRNALAAAYTRVSQNRRAARETRPKEGWALAQESKMYANGADDQRDKKDEQDERAGGVFGDLSFAQILASALAAGVSFSLSSQIGVAGSLIGAIVGAAAATVASSVLNNLFSKSAEAIKGAVSTDAGEAPAAEKPAASAAGETSLMPHPVDADQPVGAEAPAGATATQNLAAGETRPATASLADDTEVKFAPSGTRIAPASLRRAVHESQRRDTKRRLVVVSIVAGIAAVLISALLVNALTQGKGIGTTPGRTQETTATEQAQTTQKKTEAEKPEETDKSEKSAESDSTQSTDTSSNSDTTGSTTDSTTSNSGTSSNSGNNSSSSNSSTGDGSSSSNNSGSSSTTNSTGSNSSTNSGSNSSSTSDSSNSSSSTDSTKGNGSTSATKGTGSSSGSTGSGATTSGTSGN